VSVATAADVVALGESGGAATGEEREPLSRAKAGIVYKKFFILTAGFEIAGVVSEMIAATISCYIPCCIPVHGHVLRISFEG
jgi:hypothetical protein